MHRTRIYPLSLSLAITALVWVATPTRIIAAPPSVDSSVVPFPAYGTPLPAPLIRTPTSGIPPHVTLAKAIAIAAALSPTLAAARASYRIAAADVDIAKVPLNPGLAAQGAYEAQGGVLIGNTPSHSATLSFSQLVYDGGRTIALIRAAQGVALSAGQTYRRALETLAFNVAQGYYGALLAASQTRLQLQIVQQDLLQERLIAAQIRAGTAARIDLETAQIPTAQARLAVVRAQGSELAADAAFANSLGLQADADVAPLDDATSDEASALPHETTLDYSRAVARALSMRPDFLAAQEQLASAQLAVSAARRMTLPSLSVEGSTGSASSSGFAWSPTSQASATLTVPIYDQGEAAAQTATAIAAREEAVATSDIAKLTVESDVRQALVQLVAAQAALGQTTDELAKASDVLGATQTQYRAGQTTLPLLLNAQAQLSGAETDRLTARYALRQAEQTYLYALGQNDPGEGASR